MSKLSLAGVSLLAAIPGGFLAFLIGKDLVGNFADMAMPVQAASAIALLGCALAVLVPPGVLVFGPKSGNAEPKKKKEKEKDAPKPEAKEKGKKGKAAPAEEADLEESGLEDAVEEAPSEELEAADEVAASDEFEVEADDLEMDDLDAFDDDKPSKSKKR